MQRVEAMSKRRTFLVVTLLHMPEAKSVDEVRAAVDRIYPQLGLGRCAVQHTICPWPNDGSLENMLHQDSLSKLITLAEGA
jgi:hypothetical protein